MPVQEQYIPGVPCWVDANYPNPEPALDFYRGLFGWDFLTASENTGERFFMATIDGDVAAGIAELPAGHPAAPEWNTYIAVDNADDIVAKVKAAGGSVIAEPFDVGQGAGRMAIFKDPEGAAFCVWQAGRTQGVKRVNEHGAVNFNSLLSADPSAAKAFYGAVFGWTTMSVGPGNEFWTLPAYGDHLESVHPGTRKRNADMGAPGFENVVASLQPLDAGESPRWRVTFGIDDARAAARQVESLGGKVLSGPTDATYTRFAVVADPLGTAFVVGQFVPENAPKQAAAA